MLKAWLRGAPLVGHFALTFAGAGACWTLSPVFKTGSPRIATLLMVAGSFGPSVALRLAVTP